MRKFYWSEEYAVGIRILDEQHRRFFEIADKIIDLESKQNTTMDELLAVAEQNATRNKLLAAAKELEAHAAGHLKTEEDYFDSLNYPSAQLHVEAHNLFRKRVDNFLAMIADENIHGEDIAEEMASYCIFWLSDHILLMDKKYTVFFREHGLK